MEIRKKILWIFEHVARLSLWAFLLSISYGVLKAVVKYIGNPNMPTHLRVAIGSLTMLALSLFFIFASDNEVW